MGKIKATRKLVTEQFPPEHRTWLANLFSLVNQFITEVVGALNGGIVFSENITGVEREFDFIYTSSAASFPQKFTWTLAAKPVALQVCQAVENGEPVMITLLWEYTDAAEVSVTYAAKITTAPALAALTVGARYKIRVRLTP